MSFKQLFIFFIRDSYGNPKLSLIPSIFGLLIGSYSIFMIMSIMDGIETNFSNKINSYHYKYYVNNDIIKNQSYDISNFNRGHEKIACINESNIYTNILGIDNLDVFFNEKLSKYSSFNNESFIQNNHVIIGQDIASKLDLEIGDSISIFYPSDINIASSFTTIKLYEIYAVFNIPFLDYNSNIFTQLNNLDVEDRFNVKYYYDNLDFSKNIEYSKNNIYSNLIIDGLNLEKKVYYFFAFFAIILSCFIFFSTMVILINDKSKQFITLNVLGMNINKIILKLFILNYIMSSLIVLSTIFFVNGSLFLYNKYNILSFIYSSLPFSPNYISLINSEVSILFFIITVIISFFSTLPIYYLDRKESHVRF